MELAGSAEGETCKVFDTTPVGLEYVPWIKIILQTSATNEMLSRIIGLLQHSFLVCALDLCQSFGPIWSTLTFCAISLGVVFHAFSLHTFKH